MSAIRPNAEAFQQLAASTDEGPVVMLNLLKFKPRADSGDISGRESYNRYGRDVKPMVEALGGRIIWHGRADQTLIGDESAEWDSIALVEYLVRGPRAGGGGGGGVRGAAALPARGGGGRAGPAGAPAPPLSGPLVRRAGPGRPLFPRGVRCRGARAAGGGGGAAAFRVYGGCRPARAGRRPRPGSSSRGPGAPGARVPGSGWGARGAGLFPARPRGPAGGGAPGPRRCRGPPGVGRPRAAGGGLCGFRVGGLFGGVSRGGGAPWRARLGAGALSPGGVFGALPAPSPWRPGRPARVPPRGAGRSGRRPPAGGGPPPWRVRGPAYGWESPAVRLYRGPLRAQHPRRGGPLPNFRMPETSIFYEGTEGELYKHDDDPHQWYNLWNDPKYAAIRSDLIEDLYANLPDERRPLLKAESAA